jgi:hypothetical protein
MHVIPLSWSIVTVSAGLNEVMYGWVHRERGYANALMEVVKYSSYFRSAFGERSGKGWLVLHSSIFPIF